MQSDKKEYRYKGQCLCGSVQYAVAKLEPRMAHCHCTMCRKFHGAAFATFGEARFENFTWLRGGQHLKTYRADNGSKRQFCDQCGSSMTFSPANDNGEYVEFSLGTLDTDIEIRPDAHIYTAYCANWYEIMDNLPQYAESRLSDRKKI